MYNLESPGPNEGRMPGAGSAQPTFKVLNVPTALCTGCVNDNPIRPFELNGPAGHCGAVCPGHKKILVRA
jgi:hypothetical protein